MKNLTLIYKNTLILSVLILNYVFESNKNISIISVKGTGKYSPCAAYGDNHTLGER